MRIEDLGEEDPAEKIMARFAHLSKEDQCKVADEVILNMKCKIQELIRIYRGLVRIKETYQDPGDV